MNFSWDVLKVLEEGCFHKTTLKISKHSLQLHTLSQLLQVKFLKHYLEHGFISHMKMSFYMMFSTSHPENKQQMRECTLLKEKRLSSGFLCLNIDKVTLKMTRQEVTGHWTQLSEKQRLGY